MQWVAECLGVRGGEGSKRWFSSFFHCNNLQALPHRQLTQQLSEVLSVAPNLLGLFLFCRCVCLYPQGFVVLSATQSTHRSILERTSARAGPYMCMLCTEGMFIGPVRSVCPKQNTIIAAQPVMINYENIDMVAN